MVGARSRLPAAVSTWGVRGVELALMLSFRRAQELVGTGSWCRCLALPPTTNRGARASGARRNEFPPRVRFVHHTQDFHSPFWLFGLGGIFVATWQSMPDVV